MLKLQQKIPFSFFDKGIFHNNHNSNQKIVTKIVLLEPSYGSP